MRTLSRRQARIERMAELSTAPPPLTALAFDTGAGNLALVGGEWLALTAAVGILQNRAHHGWAHCSMD